MLNALTKVETTSLTEVADRLVDATARVSDPSRALGGQMEQLARALQLQVEAARENSEVLRTNTEARSGEGAVRATMNVAKEAGSGFPGVFGLSPIVSGLMKLFGRSSERSAPAPLPPAFKLPPAMRAELGIADGGELQEVSWGQNGLARSVSPRGSAGPVAITLNVNALDARSILDRSEDLAAAVRSAMLQSHGINDVLGDL